MKRQRIPQFNHDANRQAMTEAGRLAREQDKLLHDCPSLAKYFGGARAAALEGAWAQGWRDKDAELREPRYAMKGAD